MSAETITPARLRELADECEKRSVHFEAQARVCTFPSLTFDYLLDAGSGERETAAALRAAADWRAALEAEVSGDIDATRDQLLSAVDAGADQADIQRLNRAVWKLFDRAHALRLTFRRLDAVTAALAAREELLRRAERELRSVAESLETEIEARRPGELPRRIERDLAEVEAARSLAAEIAAALGGTDE